MTRILVTGGRDYDDLWTIHEVLDGIHKATPITCLIEGGSLGADRFARSWAERNGVRIETYKADWTTLGRVAGPRRNERMINEGQPDRVVAFPGGKGTANCVSQARRALLPVLEVAE